MLHPLINFPSNFHGKIEMGEFARILYRAHQLLVNKLGEGIVKRIYIRVVLLGPVCIVKSSSSAKSPRLSSSS